MLLSDLLEGVDLPWRVSFTRFVMEGKLDPAFERELNSNASLQAAVDRVLDSQASEFDALDAALSAREEDGQPHAVPELVAAGLAAAAKMPEKRLNETVSALGNQLDSMLTPAEKQRLPGILARLEGVI